MPRVRVTRQSAQTLDKISNMETHIAGSKLSISVAKTRIESVLRLRYLKRFRPSPKIDDRKALS